MRIIFLDIDGPVIPFGMFLIDRMSSHHRVLAPIPIACLLELCKRADAQIVFNTTHNQSWEGILDIDQAFIARGFPERFIHPDMKTRYPSIERDNAVFEWLSRHPETIDWIAFDDARFTELDNLIWIDPDAGIHLGHLNQALDRWNCTQFLVL